MKALIKFLRDVNSQITDAVTQIRKKFNETIK